jgi:hypothetical protein
MSSHEINDLCGLLRVRVGIRVRSRQLMKAKANSKVRYGSAGAAEISALCSLDCTNQSNFHKSTACIGPMGRLCQ